MLNEDHSLRVKTALNPKRSWIYDLLLVLILVVGAYFRLVGISWDEDQHVHPDERFLTFVETAIAPVQNLSEYFDTDNSSLNPHNRGHQFYVYGTLPIFVVRYTGEWLQEACSFFIKTQHLCDEYQFTGYGGIHLIGRVFSALVDLMLVFVVYLAGVRLFDKRVGLVAAAFSACTVLQIQQSHYFTVDTFANFFNFLAVYFAIRVATRGMRRGEEGNGDEEEEPGNGPETPKQKPFNLLSFIWFGVALGMATASKINAAPVALVLPAAVLVRLARLTPEQRNKYMLDAFSYLVTAAVVSLVVFRIFQPYAFSGPSFFNILPNQKWVDNLMKLRSDSSGDLDWPPSIQWARRPVTFSVQNMVLWGLGVPLGIVAWAGFLWVGFRMLRGNWQRHILLWGWTGVYFIWQSMAFNPTMRYQLMIYPALTIYGGWAVMALWDKASSFRPLVRKWVKPAVLLVGVLALGGTALWAFAFTRIYTRSETRIAASRWIYENIPGPLTLKYETADGVRNQPLSVPYDKVIQSGTPYSVGFTPLVDGTLTEIKLKFALAPFVLSIYDSESGENPIASTTLFFDYHQVDEENFFTALFNLPYSVPITPGRTYVMKLELPKGYGNLQIENIELRNVTPLEGEAEPLTHNLLAEPRNLLVKEPFEVEFGMGMEVGFREVYLEFSIVQPLMPESQPMQVAVTGSPDSLTPLATATRSVGISTDKGKIDSGFTFGFAAANRWL
jgi:hypothetical protein